MNYWFAMTTDGTIKMNQSQTATQGDTTNFTNQPPAIPPLPPIGQLPPLPVPGGAFPPPNLPAPPPSGKLADPGFVGPLLPVVEIINGASSFVRDPNLNITTVTKIIDPKTGVEIGFEIDRDGRITLIVPNLITAAGLLPKIHVATNIVIPW